MNAQLFAIRHPDEVAGVVLVDSLHPDLDEKIEPLLGERGARRRRRALARNVEGVTYADLLASDDVLRAARGDFPPVPLIALQHGISFDPGGEPVPSIERLWGRLQEANASLSPEGRVVVAEQSHHRIAEDQPEVVVDAIREVVTAARAG
jgi:pimeloyl-ACP methyl ester carboxylesterase